MTSELAIRQIEGHRFRGPYLEEQVAALVPRSPFPATLSATLKDMR